MIAGKSTASRLQQILQTVSLYAGRDVAAELAHWPGKSPMRFGIRQRAADWDNAQSEKLRGARSFSLKAVHAFSQNGRAANQTDRRLSPSAARGQAEAL